MDQTTERSSVVIASEDDAIRAYVRLTLGPDRFEIHEARDTDDAVAAIARELPRLLVLDHGLPGAGALALARSTRDHAETSETRVLLLVQRGAEMAGGDGVDAVIALPATSFALLRKVDQLLPHA